MNFNSKNLIDIEKIQPSQLFINRSKLDMIKQNYCTTNVEEIPPIPIIHLNEEYIYVDGHTRAFYLWSRGEKKILTYIYTENDIDLREYEIFVNWCKEENIRKISDLELRIIENYDYEKRWIKRCESLQ